jgi:hypothetical protein
VPAVITSLASSWSSVYSNSALWRTVIAFAHIGGLLVGGGAALVADRAVLRAARGGTAARALHASEFAATHRVVLSGLAAVLTSGVLLAAADLDTYLVSTTFWVKMGAVALLLVNGGVMVMANRIARGGPERTWSILRATAVLSIALWLITTLLGAALPNV